MSKNIVLEGVSLRCFKRHGELDVSFSPNVTAIRGPNYAGKSSVLQALFFAMFGVTAVPGGKAAILKDGAKEVTVKFFFTVDGEEAQVIRTLGAASVYVKGELVASGNTVVSKWFEDLFGMEQKTVMMLAYSSQGETSAMVTLGATALNRIIETVADTDYIDTLMEKAGKIATKADAELSVLGAFVDITPLSEAVEGYEQQLKEMNNLLLELMVRRDLLKAEAERNKRTLNEAVDNNTKAQKYKSDLATLENLLEYKQTSLVRHEEQYGDVLNGRDYDTEINELNDQVAALRRAVSNYNAIKVVREGAESGLKKVTDWLEGPGAQMEKDWNEIHPQWVKAQAAVEQEETILASLKEELGASSRELLKAEKDLANSICATCKRPLDESHVEHARTEHAVLKEKVDEQIKAVGRQTLTMVAHKDKANVLKAKLPDEQWKQWKVKATQAQEDYVLKLAGLPELEEPDESKVSVMDRQIGELLNTRKSANQAISTRETLKKGIEDAKIALGELLTHPLEVVDILPLRQLVDSSAQTYNESVSELNKMSMDMKALGVELKSTKDKLLLETDRNNRRKTAEVRASRFKALQKWLRDNKAAFMENIWNGLLGVCSDFVAQVTSNRVTQIERDPDGTFYFTENGSRLPMVCASGGQKSIVGVGIRIALATLLPQACRFVALDEPSAELNDEHAAALAGALRGQDRQVILVTHREGDEFASDAVVVLG